MIGKEGRVVVVKQEGNLRKVSKLHITRLRIKREEVMEEEEEGQNEEKR